jgi:hypothetical protein
MFVMIYMSIKAILCPAITGVDTAWLSSRMWLMHVTRVACARYL